MCVEVTSGSFADALHGPGFERGLVNLTGAHDREQSVTFLGRRERVAHWHPTFPVLFDKSLVMEHDRCVELLVPHSVWGKHHHEETCVKHDKSLPVGPQEIHSWARTGTVQLSGNSVRDSLERGR